MKIRLIAAGDRPPRWVAEGYREYARRLANPIQLELTQISQRTRNPHERMLAAIPDGATVVALNIAGQAWSTEELAGRLKAWLMAGRDAALLIGGADGLSRDCLDRADQHWSLGPLTLPHMLVRVVVAEQLYRAWTVLDRHPYHRA